MLSSVELSSLAPRFIALISDKICASHTGLRGLSSLLVVLPMRRRLDAAQPLQHTLGLVGHGVDRGSLVTNLVETVLHGLDEALACLVGTVLVDGVVDVDEDDLNVVGLLGGAVRVDAGDADELEEIEKDGLGQPLEVQRSLAVGVGGRGAVAVGGGREALDPRFLEGGQLILELWA